MKPIKCSSVGMAFNGFEILQPITVVQTIVKNGDTVISLVKQYGLTGLSHQRHCLDFETTITQKKVQETVLNFLILIDFFI